MNTSVIPRWRKRLEKEQSFRFLFSEYGIVEWKDLLKTRNVTSTNYDTVLSLDWPHYCYSSTQACGGINGWCYSFQGNQAGRLHDQHVAMVDVLARNYPDVFGETVAVEVYAAVKKGLMPYPNLRYGGSGEVVDEYLPALEEISRRNIHLWGFTRDIAMARALRRLGAAVIISCDKTSPLNIVNQAIIEKFPLGYSSVSVEDIPPHGTVVTFPVHRVGRVREVVDSPTVCPKVLSDFLDDSRPKASCQERCLRCHNPEFRK